MGHYSLANGRHRVYAGGRPTSLVGLAQVSVRQDACMLPATDPRSHRPASASDAKVNAYENYRGPCRRLRHRAATPHQLLPVISLVVLCPMQRRTYTYFFHFTQFVSTAYRVKDTLCSLLHCICTVMHYCLPIGHFVKKTKPCQFSLVQLNSVSFS